MFRGRSSSVAVIGAGMAGLSCARRLAGGGCRVTVVDKSGDIGGRLATRRRGDMRWNHGAPAVDARDPAFLALLDDLAEVHGAARAGVGNRHCFYGQPDMRELLRPLARQLDVRTGRRVQRLDRTGGGWWLTPAAGARGLGPFDAVVLTLPAPQALALLQASDIVVPDALPAVRLAPCWALLLGYRRVPPGLTGLAPGGAIAQVTGARAARQGTWVAHADAGWSEARLEWDQDAVALELFVESGRVLGRDLPVPDYLAAHRWRFARVVRPLGRDCLWLDELNVGLAGDWCPGGDAEGAFLSGAALAGQLLASRGG